MKKGIFGVIALMIFAISSFAVSAFNGGFFDQEVREDIISALDNEDFEEWEDVMQSMITEENFERELERHNQMKNRNEEMESVRDAIEAEDYDAYQEAIANLDATMHRELTEEEFEILVESHKAMQEGDIETANDLREELGFDFGGFIAHKSGRMGGDCPFN